MTTLLALGTAAASLSPATAADWTYTGPNGVHVTHWGTAPYRGPCCFGGGAVAVTPRLAYVAPPVIYAPPHVVYVAPPRVVYVPGGYYYVP